MIQASEILVQMVFFKKFRHEQRIIIAKIDQIGYQPIQTCESIGINYQLLRFLVRQNVSDLSIMSYFNLQTLLENNMATHQCPSPMPGFKYRQCSHQRVQDLYLFGNQTVQKYPIFHDDQIGFVDRFWGVLIQNGMDEDNESTSDIVQSGVRRGVKLLTNNIEENKSKTTNHTDDEESYFSMESIKSTSTIHSRLLFQKKSTTFSEINPLP